MKFLKCNDIKIVNQKSEIQPENYAGYRSKLGTFTIHKNKSGSWNLSVQGCHLFDALYLVNAKAAAKELAPILDWTMPLEELLKKTRDNVISENFFKIKHKYSGGRI